MILIPILRCLVVTGDVYENNKDIKNSSFSMHMMMMLKNTKYFIIFIKVNTDRYYQSVLSKLSFRVYFSKQKLFILGIYDECISP